MTTIYGLADPKTGELRYIGKTKGNIRTRLNAHMSDVRRGRVYIPRHKWIFGLINDNLAPEIFEIEIVSDEEWVEAEQFWIAYFRSLGCRLLNATAGGDGLHSFKHRDETKARQSAAGVARYADGSERVKTGEAVRKALATAEAKKNLSEGRKRVPSSSYDKFREWARSEENRSRAREWCIARTGVPMSDETKRKLSKAMTGHKRTPESIAKTAAGLRGRKHSPETLAKMSMSAKARYAKLTVENT